ncbi:MAG: penicillin-insensitive murein endopeptidase, partial [Pseudomonadota bacterium]
HASIIKRAASDERVGRIFVHPAIKQGLCRMAPQLGRGETDWLRRVRPWYGHHYHFHVRLNCPAGASQCKNQDPPPAGTGCGGMLDYWLSDEPWTPKAPPSARVEVREKTLASLPQACRTVLTAGGRLLEVAIPTPRGRGE